MNIIGKTAYQCGVCKNTYLDKESAEKCCTPKFCEDCGVELKPWWYRTICKPCHEKRQFNNAEKLTPEQWDGWVQRDGYGYNEGYFESLDDLLEYCKDEDIKPPNWVFCCELVEHKLDIDDAIETMLEEAHEDARDYLINEDELRQFIEEWNAKQKVATYYPDYSRVVVLK